MASLIPAFGSVTAKMTGGERRFAQRLEAKLEDDYLCWYDVSIGERTRHPDFVIFHPNRGLLVIEVKDWRFGTIQSIDKYKILNDSISGSISTPFFVHHIDLLTRHT